MSLDFMSVGSCNSAEKLKFIITQTVIANKIAYDLFSEDGCKTPPNYYFKKLSVPTEEVSWFCFDGGLILDRCSDGDALADKQTYNLTAKQVVVLF